MKVPIMGLDTNAAAGQQLRDVTPTESIARQIIDQIVELEVREAGLKDNLNLVQADLYRLRGARDGMSQGHQLAESQMKASNGPANAAVVGRAAY